MRASRRRSVELDCIMLGLKPRLMYVFGSLMGLFCCVLVVVVQVFSVVYKERGSETSV